jgi:oligoribonuclease
MAKKASLLWLDLEMSGTDVESDVILEVAAIATGWGFSELATFEGIVWQEESLVRAQMAKTKDAWSDKNFWDENPEARDGLLAQNKDGKEITSVEQAIVEFVDANFDATAPIYLAGNSIHNDRRFIAKYMPAFDDKLHYRMLDVTAWKLVFENKFHKKFAQPKEHRALEDIRRSIRELEYYLKKVKA